VDLKAKLTITKSEKEIVFVAEGQLLTTSHQPLPGEGVRYRLTYTLRAEDVIISGKFIGSTNAAVHLIVPIIEPGDKGARQANPHLNPEMALLVSRWVSGEAELTQDVNTFNLVPGFECTPHKRKLQPGKEENVKLFVTKISGQILPSA
jgi:hypothetical protein